MSTEPASNYATPAERAAILGPGWSVLYAAERTTWTALEAILALDEEAKAFFEEAKVQSRT